MYSTNLRQMLTDGSSSLVIDELCDWAVDRKIAVACFYCDFQSQKMQTPENVLGALVKQIVRKSDTSHTIPAEIAAEFQKAKGYVGGRGLRVPEVLKLLRAALTPFDGAFVCIDALDELLEQHLPKLLRSLHVIYQSCPGIRFFFIGRSHITVEMEEYFPGSARLLQTKPIEEDIRRYVKMMLDDDPDPAAMNTDLREEIMNRVSETISDVYVTSVFSSSLDHSLTVAPRFLLVSLSIAAILDETSIYERREQLKKMTSGRGLGDAYRVTLDRIKAQNRGKSRLGMAALMWISRSGRPMRVDELCHALGVQIGSTAPNPENIPSVKRLLASCLGLVIVDKEETTVRLVHFILQEYINSRVVFQNPYAVMAEVCLTYLNFSCIRKLPPALDAAPLENPFLQYASGYWGHYARNETTDGVKSLALQLLDRFDSHISAKLLLSPHVLDLMIGRVRLAKGFTGLHCVAYLGIDGIAGALLNKKDWDVDQADFVGHTPLIWASKNGHEGIIRLLLEKAGANPNAKDTRNGQTALSWAAQYGQEGVAKLLLARDGVNPELRDNYGRTPLSHAVECGSEGIAKLLLERQEVNPKSRDDYGRTPLPWADRPGQSRQGIVRLLLGRDVRNLESQDTSDPSSLWHVVKYRRKRIVKLPSEPDEVPVQSLGKSVCEYVRHPTEKIQEHTGLGPGLLSLCLCAFSFFLFWLLLPSL